MTRPGDPLGAVDTSHPARVAGAIDDLLRAHYGRRWDSALLEHAFAETALRYAGGVRGTLACDTPYHDLQHALATALACARLVDGWERTRPAALRLGPAAALATVLLGLLHDVGFLRRSDERHLPGGSLTAQHEARSAAMAAAWLERSPLAGEAHLAALIAATRLGSPIDSIAGERNRTIARMLATADLLSQLADRCYLEKCRDFLYAEFVDAGLARGPDGRNPGAPYASPEDLLRKTPGFCEAHVIARLDGALGGVHRLMAAHFEGDDPYARAIEGNLRYLRRVLATDDFGLLRRQPAPVYAADWRPALRKAGGAG